jgi:1-pyrroline-5-carboxylate dehydrogenase
MSNETFTIPTPKNEPVLGFKPGSPEKKELKARIKELKSKPIEIPIIIGSKVYKTKKLGECRCPHDRKTLLARYHTMEPKHVTMAIREALRARKKWAEMPWNARAAIFLKMADLLAGPHRATLNAATMLCQSKTVHQAEIDSACELIDFFRFNAFYMQQIYDDHPDSAPGMWNRLQYRPLEGFIYAITPFNFTSIAGNLPTAPALMGNVVLWKCARSAVYSAHFLRELFKEAGIPDGVITLMLGSGGVITPPLIKHPYFNGIHFTGSTEVFNHMWREVLKNIDNYKTYPRIVGETGGKDFIFVHPSADVDAVVTACVRGAYEYQGQKCSAASRTYIPKSLWPEIKAKLLKTIKTIKMGDVEDFRNFMAAVIDEHAFDSISSYIDYAKKARRGKVLIGGGYSKKKGFFIEPTVIQTTDPKFKTIEEEIFGPVLTVYVYNDKDYLKTLRLCDKTSPYALTGAIFANDREAVLQAERELVHAAGNFYINDKPTGAVVGQQPFGGSRASGTNDKAGSPINLMKWVTPRTIKETFNPPKDYKYPFMAEK